MGLFIGQNEKRSELQSKIIADLQQKVHQTSALEGEGEPEPKYLEDQHETRTAGIVISLLIVVFVCVVIFLVTRR